MDDLRQQGLEEWPQNHPALLRFKAKRCATLAEAQAAQFEEDGGFTERLYRVQTQSRRAQDRGAAENRRSG